MRQSAKGGSLLHEPKLFHSAALCNGVEELQLNMRHQTCAAACPAIEGLVKGAGVPCLNQGLREVGAGDGALTTAGALISQLQPW